MSQQFTRLMAISKQVLELLPQESMQSLRDTFASNKETIKHLEPNFHMIPALSIRQSEHVYFDVMPKKNNSILMM
jgi:hypothetical protein